MSLYPFTMLSCSGTFNMYRFSSAFIIASFVKLCIHILATYLSFKLILDSNHRCINSPSLPASPARIIDLASLSCLETFRYRYLLLFMIVKYSRFALYFIGNISSRHSLYSVSISCGSFTVSKCPLVYAIIISSSSL